MRSILSEDIDVFEDRDTERAATRFQADRGLVVLHGVRGSSIDPSAEDGITSKVGTDATRRCLTRQLSNPLHVFDTCKKNI